MSHFAQLSRIVLIDSINKGNLIELPVDSNTVLLGTNGIGKTTFLKLLAVFYGSPPGLAVRADGNNLSFADWFLPRHSSYLVFEYKNHRFESCCMILHRSGDTYAYRLVSGAWETSLLYEDEENGDIVSPSELIVHLRNRYRNCTPELTGTAYRSIIQFNTNNAHLDHLSDARQKQLVQSNRPAFSLAPPRKSIAGVDTITLTLIESHANYRGLRKVVADILAQENIDPDKTLQALNVNDFTTILRQQESILLFDSLLPRIEELSEQEKKYLSVLEQLAKVKYRLKKLKESYTEKESDAVKQIASLEQKQAEQQEKHNKKEEEFRNQRSDAAVELDIAQKHYAQLTERKQSYERMGIEQMVQRSTQRETLLQQKRMFLDERDVLMQGQRDITMRFERLIAEAKNQHANAVEQLRKQQEKHRATFDQWREQYSTTAHSMRVEYEQQRDEQIEAYRQQYQEADSETVKWITERHQLEGQGELSTDQAQLREALNAINTLREEKEQLHANAQRLKDQHHQLTRSHQDSVRKVEIIQGEITDKQYQRDGFISQLNASRSTLLGFLREHHPDWQDTIARVVSPDILMRDDLNPEMVSESVDSLYGVALDTTSLPLPMLADTDSLRQSIAQCEAAIQELQQEHEEQKKIAQRIEKETKAKQGEVSQAEQVVLNSNHQIDAAVRRYEALQSEAKERFEQKVAQLDAQVNQSQTHANQLKKRWEDAVAMWKDRLRDLHEAQQREYQEKHKQYADTLAQLEQSVADLVASHEVYVEQLNNQQRDALSEKGIDPERLTQLEKQLASIDTQLKKIDEERDAVESYQRWLEREWSEAGQLEIKLNEAQHKKNEIDRQYSEWSQVVRQEQQAQRKEIALLQKEREKLQGHVSLTKRLLVSFGLESIAERPDTSYFYANQDPKDTQDELVKLTEHRNQIQKSAERTYREIRDWYGRHRLADSAYYEEIQRIDALAQQQAQSSETWLAAVEPLRTTLLEAHKNQKETFVLRLYNVGRQACDSKGALNDLHRSINRLGVKVTERSKDITQPFDALEIQNVKIQSKIPDLSFWDDLHRFEKEFERWQALPGEGMIPHPMPSEGLIGALRVMKKRLEGNPISATLSDCFDFEVAFFDQGKFKVINSDSSFESASSNGLNTIILCLMFVALFELLRDDIPLKMVFPLDEALTISPKNNEALFKVTSIRNIMLVAAFPAGSAETMARFDYAYQFQGRAHEEMTVSQYENPDMDDLDALEQLLEESIHE